MGDWGRAGRLACSALAGPTRAPSSPKGRTSDGARIGRVSDALLPCHPPRCLVCYRTSTPLRLLTPACPPVTRLLLGPLVRVLFLTSILARVPILSAASAQRPERARDLGVPLEGTTGALDAITDVAGVEVGHRTLVAGHGKRVVGKGPVRTGVTAIFPRGKASDDPVFAGWFSMNGNGEMTGTTWVEESGFLWGPVMLTNTHSVGVVRDAVIAWAIAHDRMHQDEWSLPVVAETWDGGLNDIYGFHVSQADAWAAMDSAHGGVVPEGNVGGGTGMICNRFKGGIGTASRRVEGGGYTVGVLVQCNYGARAPLRIAGVPVGREVPDLMPCHEPCNAGRSARDARLADDVGSIIIVVASDAPLLPHQLKRLAKRAALGVGRMGGLAAHSSGDLFLAFSTGNPRAAVDSGLARVTMLPDERITPLYEATVQATEEAIVNAMLAAQTMTGADDLTVYALPHDRLRGLLRKYNRLSP
jgi:D-aminopeptidase